MCEMTVLGFCLTRAPAESGPAIFGFAEFLTALALLVLVFNSTDFLYRFRTAVAPIPLFAVTFWGTLIIGLGTLVTDLWFAKRWYSLPWGVGRPEIQSLLGLMFLSIAILWVWFAFVSPPRFSRWNYKRFHGVLYGVIVRGAESELGIIAKELARSSVEMVRLSVPKRRRQLSRTADPVEQKEPECHDYAQQTLIMISNGKLCRHIAASSPVTAIAIAEEVSKSKAYNLPIGSFMSKVTEECLINKDSILYHEEDYGGDLISHFKPFTNSMYGDYGLVNGNIGKSPLDIGFKLSWKMDGEQLEAYCRIVLTTIKSYVDKGLVLNHSYSLFRALDLIENAGRELYKVDETDMGYDSIPIQRFSSACEFVAEAIKILNEKEDLEIGSIRKLPNVHRDTFLDLLANLMFELSFQAGKVKSSKLNWTIQHNMLWGSFSRSGRLARPGKAVLIKYHRLMYDEIVEMSKWPNFKGSSILGFSLNVMGLTPPKKTDYDKENYAFHSAVLSWARKNFVALYNNNRRVAEDVLGGTISFEPEKRRLVKTYARGTGDEPHRVYLDLDPPATNGRTGKASAQIHQGEAAKEERAPRRRRAERAKK